MAKALVLYHSQELGNTAPMAEAVAEGLREAGVEVDLFNTDVVGNLKQFMDDHYIADVRKGMQGLKGKPYALFCSHRGGGRVCEVMVSLFKRISTQVGEVVALRGYPSPGMLAGRWAKLFRELYNQCSRLRDWTKDYGYLLSSSRYHSWRLGLEGHCLEIARCRP